MRLCSTDLKLDYRDVLIVPQRSDIPSRTEINLLRTFRFRHSKKRLTGFPIIASNMDSTGTFAMAEEFSKNKMRPLIYTEQTTVDGKFQKQQQILAFGPPAFQRDMEQWRKEGRSLW